MIEVAVPLYQCAYIFAQAFLGELQAPSRDKPLNPKPTRARAGVVTLTAAKSKGGHLDASMPEILAWCGTLSRERAAKILRMTTEEMAVAYAAGMAEREQSLDVARENRDASSGKAFAKPFHKPKGKSKPSQSNGTHSRVLAGVGNSVVWAWRQRTRTPKKK